MLVHRSVTPIINFAKVIGIYFFTLAEIHAATVHLGTKTQLFVSSCYICPFCPPQVNNAWYLSRTAI